MNLPEDIVRFILTFCDIDTKRLMGIPPGRLVVSNEIRLTRPETTVIDNDDNDETRIITTRLRMGIYENRVIVVRYYFNSILCKESFLMVYCRGNQMYFTFF
jgi:hypothetical protein